MNRAEAEQLTSHLRATVNDIEQDLEAIQQRIRQIDIESMATLIRDAGVEPVAAHRHIDKMRGAKGKARDGAGQAASYLESVRYNINCLGDLVDETLRGVRY